MEFRPELYRQAFSRVKPSPEKRQEVIEMTEKKRPSRIVRRFLVTAVIMAIAALMAMGANAASGGKLFARLVSYQEFTDDNGQSAIKVEYQIDDDRLAEDGVGEFKIVQGEDGKAVLTYTDEDGKTVTEEIDSFVLDGNSSAIEQVESQAE